ncbi:RHS repeat protein, partial [Escherichia coli]|nr:RHS repeat protein [Escherichia coli]
MTSKTDARGVVTSYVYDALNRVTQRSYSTPNGTPGVGVLANYQATPNVSYFYDDVNVPFSKGRLTKVTSSISETRYNAFDNLGRVLSSSQVTDGQTYNFTYTYNLSGALIEQTYPSGRVVKNVLESDGD